MHFLDFMGSICLIFEICESILVIFEPNLHILVTFRTANWTILGHNLRMRISPKITWAHTWRETRKWRRPKNQAWVLLLHSRTKVYPSHWDSQQNGYSISIFMREIFVFMLSYFLVLFAVIRLFLLQRFVSPDYM